MGLTPGPSAPGLASSPRASSPFASSWKVTPAHVFMACERINSETYINMNTFIHTERHTHIHAYTHARTRTYARTYIPTYMHTHIRTHTHTHTHTHTRTHTHARTPHTEEMDGHPSDTRSRRLVMVHALEQIPPTSSHSAYWCHCPAWHLQYEYSCGGGEYSGGFGPLRPAARCLGRDHSEPADGAAAEAVRAPERTLAARSMWLVRLQG